MDPDDKRNKLPGSFLLPEDGVIDEFAIHLAMNGTRRVGLTKSERVEIARRLFAEGHSVAHVRYRLKVSQCVMDGILTTLESTDELIVRERHLESVPA